MRKTDFQLEEELSSNLRNVKPKGPADLLQDRFDSVFRRNMLAPEAPSTESKKRFLKAKYKWHSSKGGEEA